MENVVMIIMKIILAVCLAMILLGPPIFYLIEKKQFNHGHCPQCGGMLCHFATDSQGSEGWVCENGDYLIWTSWINPYREIEI